MKERAKEIVNFEIFVLMCFVRLELTFFYLLQRIKDGSRANHPATQRLPPQVHARDPIQEHSMGGIPESVADYRG
jgi:hypothetical protein